jgi:hypothetical protein
MTSPLQEPVPSVNPSLTQRTRRRVVENDEYTAFLGRVIRALARRVSGGDIDAITDMAALSGDLDNAIRAAVTGLRTRGYSWTEIGARLGVTRQAAQQRFGGEAQ